MPRKPLPDPSTLLPAYESQEAALRRVVREELRPLHELLEQIALAQPGRPTMREPVEIEV